MCYLKVLCQEIHSGMFNLMGTLTSSNNTLSGPSCIMDNSGIDAQVKLFSGSAIQFCNLNIQNISYCAIAISIKCRKCIQ